MFCEHANMLRLGMLIREHAKGSIRPNQELQCLPLLLRQCGRVTSWSICVMSCCELCLKALWQLPLNNTSGSPTGPCSSISWNSNKWTRLQKSSWLFCRQVFLPSSLVVFLQMLILLPPFAAVPFRWGSAWAPKVLVCVLLWSRLGIDFNIYFYLHNSICL